MEYSETPLVSVLIPLYNHERFIEKCLDSILADPYPAKEIIVVDDGSSDSSFQVVQSWYQRNASKACGCFEARSRENRGVSSTLNELISLAKGDYIAFVSSDDYLLPGGITARMDYLRRHPNKKAVVADYQVVDQHESIVHASGIGTLYWGRKDYLANPDLIAYELIFHWCLAGPVYLFRRDIFSIFGGYDESLLVEDWDLVLRMLSRNLLGFVDYPVAAYRVHGSNAGQDPKKAIHYREALIQTIKKNIGQFNMLQKIFLFSQILLRKAEIYSIMEAHPVKRYFCQKIGGKLERRTMRVYHKIIPRIFKI